MSTTQHSGATELEQAMFACLLPQLSMSEARRCAHDYAEQAHRREWERTVRSLDAKRAEKERTER